PGVGGRLPVHRQRAAAAGAAVERQRVRDRDAAGPGDRGRAERRRGRHRTHRVRHRFPDRTGQPGQPDGHHPVGTRHRQLSRPSRPRPPVPAGGAGGRTAESVDVNGWTVVILLADVAALVTCVVQTRRYTRPEDLAERRMNYTALALGGALVAGIAVRAAVLGWYGTVMLLGAAFTAGMAARFGMAVDRGSEAR